ncbi:MAG: trypsin-like peptidase domain-containing protein [Planctomycetota bacterium]|nr:trypsin-like peptidase domain-containing protein [Planctomycetota bacterium]
MTKNTRWMIPVIAALTSTGAWGQPEMTPPVPAADLAFANSLSNAFKSVASHAEPAVIHIMALAKQRRVRYDWFGTPMEVGEAQLVPVSQGSGFLIDDQGTAVTNNHVIAGANALRVKAADGREYDATVVGRDESTDLAVIRVNFGDTPQMVRPLKLGNSEALEVGEWVVAIGSPFGFSNTVTAGIVSAKGRSLTPRETGRTYEDFIQTDAAINPGNSGGPLLNLQGEVVGVNSAIASRSGGFQGLGFAIPSLTTRAVVDNILANGRVVRGWLGVELTDAPMNPQRGSDQSRGVLVSRVVAESPAEKAGLKEGDVIVRYQGQWVNEVRLRNAIAVTRPGSKAELEVRRADKTVTLAAEVGDFASSVSELGQADFGDMGMTARTLTLDETRKMGYRNVRGVLVEDVRPNTPAARSGLEPGDIIVQVNRTTVTNVKQFAQLVSSSDFGPGARLGVIRGNRQGYIEFQP